MAYILNVIKSICCRNYGKQCNICLKCLITNLYEINVRITLRRGVLDTTLCDNFCQWLAADRFSHGTPDSSTNKTERNDITEIVLKVALNTINQTLITLWWVESIWWDQPWVPCHVLLQNQNAYHWWVISTSLIGSCEGSYYQATNQRCI